MVVSKKRKQKKINFNFYTFIFLLILLVGLVYVGIFGKSFSAFNPAMVIADTQEPDVISLESRRLPSAVSSGVEFYSNELLIKVKKSVKIKEGNPADTGLDSLNKLSKDYKIKKYEKVAKEGKNSKTDDDIFRWYKITLDKEQKIISSNKSSLDDIELRKLSKDLLNDSSIELVELNYLAKAFLVPNDPYYSSLGTWGQPYPDLWGMKKINVESAWDLITDSSSVIIADIDTGIDRNHEDLQGNMWVNTAEVPGNNVDDDRNGYIDDYYGWNFAYNNNDPMDDNGHGTHTAGTMAAVGNNGIGVVGVNWKAKIMAVKFLGGLGSGSNSAAAAALVYAADMGARVSSNSWGCSCSSQIVKDAIKYEYNKGMVIVAAAGNDNYDIKYYTPASYDEVITVGAMDPYDQKATFSNYGEQLDLVAPGVDILSLRTFKDPYIYACDWNRQSIVGTNYCRLSGTSMATPHVAGLAGLLLAYRPNLNNDLVYSIIQATADDLESLGFDIYTGYGRINAFNALSGIDAKLVKPELLVSDIRVGKKVAAPVSPISVSVDIKNAGKVPVYNVIVELFDGSPSSGGIRLAQWTVNLGSEYSTTIQQNIFLSNLGRHTLYALIDRQNSISEVFEGNNKKTASLEIVNFQAIKSHVIIATDLQSYPSIYGDKIIWTDYRNTYNNADIYMYDFSNRRETRITPLTGRQLSGDIDGNYIVYVDNRNYGGGNYDVYLYDITSSSEFRITNTMAVRRELALHDGRIAWSEWIPSEFNYGVFVYDLGSDGIYGTSDCNNARCEGKYRLGSYSIQPDLYGNNIIWLDKRNQYLETYLYYLGPDGAFGTNDCVDGSNNGGTIPKTETKIVKLYPLDDVTVKEQNPAQNFGFEPILEIQNSNSGDNRHAYLEFNVLVPGTISRVNLFLKSVNDVCNADAPEHCVGFYTFSMGPTLDESMITWNSRLGQTGGPYPSYFRTSLEDVQTSDTWYSIDITPWVGNAGTAVYLIKQSTGTYDLVNFYSKDNQASNSPYLEVEYTQTLPITNTGCEGEYRIVSIDSGQWLPRIYGNRIVYEDDRNNIPVKGNPPAYNPDIYMYDLGPDGLHGTNDCYTDTNLGCEGEQRITDSLRYQLEPFIEKEKLFWVDWYTEGLSIDLFVYNISNRQRTIINSVSDGFEIRVPKSFSNRVAWGEDKNPEVLGTDMDVFVATLDDFPAPPKNVVASTGDKQISLQWDRNIEVDLKEYNVYRSKTQDSQYEFLAKTSTNSYTDRSVTNGVRYYYRITAVDNNNGESGFSAEVAVTLGFTGGGGGNERPRK